MAVMTAMMLASYSPDDPSWLAATDSPAQNLLGTLGASMVEGRISAGVVLGPGTDLGGGASVMGKGLGLVRRSGALVRFGRGRGITQAVSHGSNDLAVAGDGTVWLAGDRAAALVDGEWQKVAVRAGSETLAAGRDGVMWAAVSDRGLRVARFEGGKARIFSEDDDMPPAVRTWSDRVTGIATTPDGRTWVGVNGKGPRRPGGLLRYDYRRAA